MSTQDERVTNLINDAKRLRYSRRQILRSGSALGLSAAGLQMVLRSSRHSLAAPRQTRYQTGGKLNILAGSYFVPEAQDFFVKQVQDWGSQNGVEVTADFVNWPDIQAKVSAAVESGAGPDIDIVQPCAVHVQKAAFWRYPPLRATCAKAAEGRETSDDSSAGKYAAFDDG